MSSLSQSLHLLVMDLGCRLLQCTSVLSHASSLGEPSLGLESTFFSFVASDGEQSISDPLAETCPAEPRHIPIGQPGIDLSIVRATGS